MEDSRHPKGFELLSRITTNEAVFGPALDARQSGSESITKVQSRERQMVTEYMKPTSRMNHLNIERNTSETRALDSTAPGKVTELRRHLLFDTSHFDCQRHLAAKRLAESAATAAPAKGARSTTDIMSKLIWQLTNRRWTYRALRRASANSMAARKCGR